MKASRSVHAIGVDREHSVTAMFIATYPAEARVFLGHAHIEKGKLLNRAIATTPDLLYKDVTPEEIKNIQDAKKAAEANKKTEYCDKCNQPITDKAWTRVSLDAMARKVDENLWKLYATCYLSPTLLTHATPFGLDLRFRNTKAGEEAHVRDAMWRGHFLMLWLLRHQDSCFSLGLAERIDARCAAFSAVCPKMRRKARFRACRTLVVWMFCQNEEQLIQHRRWNWSNVGNRTRMVGSSQNSHASRHCAAR